MDKLDIVLNTLKDIYKLDNDFLSKIKDNILLRADFYKNINMNFDNENLYIKNPSSSLDFFLNRFINNARKIEINLVYNPNNVYEEDYNSETQYFKLTDNKQLMELTINKLKNRLEEVDDELAKKTYDKVISHEFGHLFQTNFKGNVGYKDERHNLFIKALCDTNPDLFTYPISEEKLEVIQNGIIPIVKNDKYKNLREYYSKKESIVMFDDIFNEDEAIQINNIKFQGKLELGRECYKNINNYETTNYKIIAFAREMKLVMGYNKSFRSMYIDSYELYEFFDKYEDLATDIFKNEIPSRKPVVNNVKINNSLYDTLKLDHFFSLCLEKRVKYTLKHNPNNNDINELKEEVREFFSLTTKCRNDILNHEVVYKRIKSMLSHY